MVYKFKSSSRITVDPQIAGELCEKLASNGGLTPRRLLDVSRDVSAPLHSAFEWNDAVAAEHYREGQAAHIIRCLVVVPEVEEAEPVRAFVSIRDENRDYRPIGVVMESEDLRAQMLDNALRDMEVFRHKYHTLTQLAPVMTAIEDVTANLEEAANVRALRKRPRADEEKAAIL